MSTPEERTKILNMIAEGKITAQEGAQLLEALNARDNRTRAHAAATSGDNASTLRVRVSDVTSGKTRVNINIPLSLINVAMRVGTRFAPDLEGIELDEVMTAINSGMRGKIMDVTDGDEHVEIFAE
jgi:hypothetical protein